MYDSLRKLSKDQLGKELSDRIKIYLEQQKKEAQGKINFFTQLSRERMVSRYKTLSGLSSKLARKTRERL